MISKHDTNTRDLFPLHLQREAARLSERARDLRERSEFFDRMGYRASARRLEDEAVRLEGRVLGMRS